MTGSIDGIDGVVQHARHRALQRLHPDNEHLRLLSPDTRLVVSEPLDDLTEDWVEVEPDSYLVLDRGRDELHALRPPR